jgi:AraC-like DNA-binding protein
MTNRSDAYTIGRAFYIGYELPLVVRHHPDRLPKPAEPPMFSLSYLDRGSAILKIGGMRTLVQAPCLWLLDETEEAGVEAVDDIALTSVCFHPCVVNSAFTPALLRRSPRPFEGTTYNDCYLLTGFLAPLSSARVRPVRPALRERIAHAFAAMERELAAQDNENWPCRSRSWLIETLFVLQLLDSSEGAIALEDDAHPLDRALLLIHERFASRFTVEDLARWCATNRTTLNAHVLRKTGRSVQSYVRAVRMAMAANLLRDTLLPVEEVMARVGYEDASHFSRAFKQIHGAPPASYRREHCWMLAS